MNFVQLRLKKISLFKEMSIKRNGSFGPNCKHEKKWGYEAKGRIFKFKIHRW